MPGTLSEAFLRAICPTGKHCAQCRDTGSRGQSWRASAVKGFGMAGVSRDFPCPKGRQWVDPAPPIAHALAALLAAHRPPPFPTPTADRGIVIAAGGEPYLVNAYVLVRLLRELGCRLPVEIWHNGPAEKIPWLADAFSPLGVAWVDATARGFLPAKAVRGFGWRTHLYDYAQADGFALKVFAVAHTGFRRVLMLDADCDPARDPSYLFDHPEFARTGAFFWPDIPGWEMPAEAWPALVGRPAPATPHHGQETGQVLIDRTRCWQPLSLAWRMNELRALTYRVVYGDTNTYLAAWLRCRRPYTLCGDHPRVCRGEAREHRGYEHVDPDGVPLLYHRVAASKWTLDGENYPADGFPHHERCLRYLADLRTMRPPPAPVERGSRRIAVCTLYTPEIADLGAIVAEGWRRYALRHAYGFFCSAETLDASRPPSWSKARMVRRAFAAGFDTVLWADGFDSAPANPDVTVESRMDGHHDAWIAADKQGPNAGVFIINDTPGTRELLRWLDEDCRDLTDDMWWEQEAVQRAIHYARFGVRWRVFKGADKRLLNAYPGDDYRPGDWIVHAPGMSLPEKERAVRAALGMPARALPAQHVPEDFDVEHEQRRLRAGGCCGAPATIA